jgi:hypothetical protein
MKIALSIVLALILPIELSAFQEEEPTTIHVLVALCDNKHQGIVPVPPSLGNGQDPKNNLYWGAYYGLKAYFKRSEEWSLIKTQPKEGLLLERLIFMNNATNAYLVADAYDGRYIKTATTDLLKYSAGLSKKRLEIQGKSLGIGGNANLLAYIGHDGLMDFRLEEKYENKDGKKRDLIVLACYSKSYFQPYVEKANVNALVWTSGLMAPEAYTLHYALSGYLSGESNEEIRARAAQAYSKYQKCSLNAAKRLLVTN